MIDLPGVGAAFAPAANAVHPGCAAEGTGVAAVGWEVAA